MGDVGEAVFHHEELVSRLARGRGPGSAVAVAVRAEGVEVVVVVSGVVGEVVVSKVPDEASVAGE